MAPKHQFYDPQVGDSDPMQIRGFQVGIGGTYVLMDDVVTAIREYAQSLDDAGAGALIHDLATWFGSGAESMTPEEKLAVVEHELESRGESLPPAVIEPEPPYGAEELDQSNDIERIEVYPDPPEDPRPKWYARSVDTSGYIMQTTGGSFDQEWVIQNASERWPGKPIHMLKSAGEDSKWIEDGTRGVHPSFGPPIRRLWAGAGR